MQCCILNTIQIWSIMYIKKGICLVFKIPRILTKHDVSSLCNITFLRWLHLKNVCEMDVDDLFLSLSQPQSWECSNVNHPVLLLTFRDSFHVNWEFSILSLMGLPSRKSAHPQLHCQCARMNHHSSPCPLLAFSLAGKIQTRNYKLLVKLWKKLLNAQKHM